MRLASFFLCAILFMAFVSAPAPAEADGGVVVNEIAWMGTSVSATDEWIELYNASDTAIVLDGWLLVTQDGSPSITLSGTIGAGAYFLLERTDDASVPGIIADHIYTGALTDSGEALELRDADGVLISSATWTDAGPGNKDERKPMARRLSGTWGTSEDSGGTPRATNTIADDAPPPAHASPPPPPASPPSTAVPEPDEPQNDPADTAPRSDDEETAAEPETNLTDAVLLLSELLPDPQGKDGEGEFVELFNAGSEEVSLSGWKIRDASGRSVTLSGTIAPGAFLAVFARDTTLPSLNNGGDVVELLDPNGVRRDGVSYGENAEGFVLVRTDDDEWTWSGTATPGAANVVTNIAENEKEGSGGGFTSLLAAPLGVAARFGEIVASAEGPNDGEWIGAGAAQASQANVLAASPNPFAPRGGASQKEAPGTSVGFWPGAGFAVAAGVLVFLIRRRNLRGETETVAFAVAPPEEG